MTETASVERRCACGTVLSRYNTSTLCGACARAETDGRVADAGDLPVVEPGTSIPWEQRLCADHPGSKGYRGICGAAGCGDTAEWCWYARESSTSARLQWHARCTRHKPMSPQEYRDWIESFQVELTDEEVADIEAARQRRLARRPACSRCGEPVEVHRVVNVNMKPHHKLCAFYALGLHVPTEDVPALLEYDMPKDATPATMQRILSYTTARGNETETTS